MKNEERQKLVRLVTPGSIVYQFPSPVPSPASFTDVVNTQFTVTSACVAICPDLLTIDAIGEADSLRGRVIRWFLTAMQLWPTKRS